MGDMARLSMSSISLVKIIKSISEVILFLIRLRMGVYDL